ncbi:uncharacterized protein ACN63O_022378 [Diretmus argenteus]
MKRKDSIPADVCPWETDDPKVGKKQDGTRPDVCPWDMEESEVVTKQESTQADVCPMVFKDQQKSAEIKMDTPDNDNDEVTENRGALSEAETTADNSTKYMEESKENLPLGRRDALCPWDMERTRSGSFTEQDSDVFTWEPENIPEEDEEDADAECAAEAFVFPSDL